MKKTHHLIPHYLRSPHLRYLQPRPCPGKIKHLSKIKKEGGHHKNEFERYMSNEENQPPDAEKKDIRLHWSLIGL